MIKKSIYVFFSIFVATNHGSCNQPGECNCEVGYGGSLCTEDHDVCGHQQPCVNKASCTNVIPDSYQCICAPGYTGNNCQIEINECHSDPCKNGAICTVSQSVSVTR